MNCVFSKLSNTLFKNEYKGFKAKNSQSALKFVTLTSSFGRGNSSLKMCPQL